jgi:predicted nucleotidyltransferase
MEALSTYELSNYDRVEETLKLIRDPDAFLNADQAFIEGGVVRFAWPDWPRALSAELKLRVDELHRKVTLLRPVEPGAEKWNLVFHGKQGDPESAGAIGEAFSACFRDRVRWVFSTRDKRGLIAATCAIQGLGNISIDLTWKGCFAVPGGPLTGDDRNALSAAVDNLSHWAGQRIEPILETLNAKLKALYDKRFRGLYVFGSYARPDAGVDLGEDSDLDVALILSDFDNISDERKRFGDIVYDLELANSLVIHVVPISEEDFRERRTNFTRVISEYAVPVK